jgi:hypothetical protein
MSSLREMEKADEDLIAFAPGNIAVTDESMLVDSSISFAIETTTLFGRQPLLRGTARPTHRRSALLDDLAGVGVTVLVALRSTPRLVAPLEHRGVALLARGCGSIIGAEQPLEPVERHAVVLPEPRYNHASRRIRLVA